MHYLLIQQAIIDEVVKQAFADGNKAIDDTKFNLDKIQPALLAKGLTFEVIEKWTAYLAMDGYFKMWSETHHRNPAYVTLTQKGLQAEISKYFEEKYYDRRRENRKTYIQMFSQGTLGIIGLIAFLITTGKSCTNPNKSNSECKLKSPDQQKTQTVIIANPHASKANYDTVAQKLFYLDTFYIGVDTVFVER